MKVDIINNEQVTVSSVTLIGSRGYSLNSALKHAQQTFEYGISTKRALLYVYHTDSKTTQLQGIIGCYNFQKKITKYNFKKYVIKFKETKSEHNCFEEEDQYLSRQHRTWYEND